MNEVQLENHDHIATITINRPAKLNAVNMSMAEAIEDCCTTINRDENVRVVVVRGAGEKAFSVGSDIAQLDDYGTAWQFRNRGARPVNYAWIGPKVRQPVIAMIRGYCLGGGFELALNCDLRIASADAEFGAPEVNWGWIGGGSASQVLPRLVGPGRAMELLITGKRIPASTAFEWGLLNRVVSSADLETTVYSMAEHVASQAPIAVQTIKQAVRYALNTPLDVGRMIENELVWGTFTTEDKAEGVRAFREKRPPKFKGR